MTAFDRPGDPIAAARRAIQNGRQVEAAGRAFAPAAYRARQLAALRQLLAEDDEDAADRVICGLLATIEREIAA